MDCLPLCTTGTTATSNSFSTELSLPSLSQPRGSRNLSFAKKPRKVLVFASKDEPPKLDQWDQMELKFGKMLGEDPKLTLAKIMARKSNPDMTYMEIEKTLQKKKGKALANEIEELPFDAGERRSANSSHGLNLVRPVPKKGVNFQSDETSVDKEDKKPRQPARKAVENSQGSLPNVILRKPSSFNDDGNETYSRFNIQPNLALKMGKERQKEMFSDITLLKKPEPVNTNSSLDTENGVSGGSTPEFNNEIDKGNMENFTLVRKPKPPNHISHNDQEQGNLDQSVGFRKVEAQEEDESVTGLQPSDISESFSLSAPSATETTESNLVTCADATLLGKPKRLDQSVKAKANAHGEEMAAVNSKSSDNGLELKNFLTSPIKEHEENDWTRAEDLVKSGARDEVEVISTSTRGFAVSFGSLVGYLPYRNLGAKWKFLAFESWLRRTGLDPSKYKQSLGVIGSFETAGKIPTTDSKLDPEFDHKFDGEISPDMRLGDLLRIYDQEKLKFLSSFVGQKIKAIVIFADRRSRRLIFSTKPKEKEELVEKKRNLMGKLSVGDVVKCCIKKITYFGIFVEVEGVPALIHQTEVSWDATLDPASYFKVGQILEAKVHQLDFSLERIFLSLKEITPDPLVEALEAVVGDHDSLDGRLEAAQADTEWAEVDSLIKELEQVEGIQSISKGRYFLSPGLAPTFQVYMASIFDNQYKLLARSGNRAQEVIVKTSLGKDEIKSAILTCTNRVQ